MNHPGIKYAVRAAKIAICVALLAMSFGCASVRDFTADDRDVHETDLHRLEFFLSSDTQLSRIIETQTKDISSERAIRDIRHQEVEEILIRQTMVGKLIGLEGDTLLVSFEPPVYGRDRSLRFVQTRAGYDLATHPSGSKPTFDAVHYNDRTYQLGKFGRKWSSFSRTYTFYPQEKPRLVVRTQSFRHLQKKVRELPGRSPSS